MTERIGVLGGTFDPVHIGHLVIAEEARTSLALDRVVFVPAAQQPFKLHQATTPAEHRLAMVRLACASNLAFSASTLEIERPSPSYTVATLQQLHAQHDCELFFIIGADALQDLPRWKNPGDVIQLTHFVAFQRPGTTLELSELHSALPALRERLYLVEGPRLDVSSSDLRRRVATGKPIRYLVPDAVADYIAQHGLYQ